MPTSDHDWSKPAAKAIPKEGYFELERGRYGPVYPRTPACYGFSIIAKVKEGREEAVRAYGKQIEEAIAGSPDVLAPLRLHYLRWVLFDVGSGLHFQYQGIFDTDFDKYTEDAVALFSATGITTVFTNLEGFPEDWKDESRRRSSSSFVSTSAPASWSTASTPTSPPTRSRRRCGSRRRSPTCSTRCSDRQRNVHRCLSSTTSSTSC